MIRILRRVWNIFPGQSNTYKLYEDDGVTKLYQKGYYIVTSIDYNYMQNNFSVIIHPIDGKTEIIPKLRDYKIRFRNCRTADSVDVYLQGDLEINAVRIINEDVNSIISDLGIPTKLKEIIADIFFSDLDIKQKRIQIKKIKGLDKRFVRMFIKLLEYIAEI